jgi:methanogenic corrinoid protein MtbC1
MVGGAPVTKAVAEQTGCDFYGEDAASGVNYSLKTVEEMAQDRRGKE